MAGVIGIVLGIVVVAAGVLAFIYRERLLSFITDSEKSAFGPKLGEAASRRQSSASLGAAGGIAVLIGIGMFITGIVKLLH